MNKDIDAFVEHTAKLYSKLDDFRVSNLVRDRETIEFLRQKLGHPPTFRNFLWHSDRLLGEVRVRVPCFPDRGRRVDFCDASLPQLLVDVDDRVKEVDPASIVFDVVNDLAGMIRSGIDQARLVNQYARGLMYTVRGAWGRCGAHGSPRKCAPASSADAVVVLLMRPVHY